MSTEPAFLGVLRELIEGRVEGGTSLLLAALAAWGTRVPVTFAEVVDLVHGPLRARLQARLGSAEAAEVVRAIERALKLAEMPTRDLVPAPRCPFDRETTKLFARANGTMHLVVLSGTGELAEQIDPLFDPARVSVLRVSTRRSLARLPAGAHLALIDGADLPPIPPHELAPALAGLPLVLVWGGDAPGAAALVGVLERSAVPTMSFARTEPEPMVDVLRARLTDAVFVPPAS